MNVVSLQGARGFGEPGASPFETVRLSLSREGVRSVGLEPWALTFGELAAQLSRAEVGDKDGSYFVRGPSDASFTRADAHITEANLIVLDGDKTVDLSTGELTTGAPPPLLVHYALRTLNVQHHIYTSHSHGAEGKGNRYRVVIPAALGSDPKALLATVDHLIGRIQAEGVPLANADENYRWSQPWYLPRKRSEDAEFQCYTHADGGPLDVAPILEGWLQQQPPSLREVAFAPAEQGVPGIGLIDRFVDTHGDPAEMSAYLGAHGYALMSTAMMNGHPCYRFLAPRSESRTPGVVLFNALAGKWRVVSFHTNSDPLSEMVRTSGKRLAHDAFDLFRILGHGGDLQAALSAADPRPTIQVSGGSLVESTRAAIASLAALETPTVFQRGNMLVSPIHLPDLVESNGVSFPKGSVMLSVLELPTLRLELARAARFVKPSGGQQAEKWKEIDPPTDLAQSVLGSAGGWDGLPVLVGVAEAPILQADGTVHDSLGYDAATRMYYEGRAPALIGCAHPDLAEAKQAAEFLLNPFAEFAFADPERDRSVVLAYLFTLALRSTLSGAPLIAVSATAPGAGKGLLIEACNLIMRGRDAAVMAPAGGKDADDEMRKRITAIALQGGASVLIDNCTSAIGGNSLNALLTSNEWTDRLLSRNQMVKFPVRVTWAATGNNLIVRGDMVRRTLSVVIDPGVERPELRTFENSNLTEHVVKHRQELMSAVYQILKGYRMAAEPGKEERLLGRFEDWSRAVAAPIRWLGFPDPIETQERLREDDPEVQKLSALLSSWFTVYGTKSLTSGEVVDEGEKNSWGALDPLFGERYASLYQAILDVASNGGSSINRMKFGWFLKHARGRVCQGYKIEKDPAAGGKPRYRVVATESN